MISEQIRKEFENTGRNLRIRRQEQKLSIQELSKKSGVSENMIFNFEEGNMSRRITVKHLWALCDVLQAEAHDILKPIK